MVFPPLSLLLHFLFHFIIFIPRFTLLLRRSVHTHLLSIDCATMRGRESALAPSRNFHQERGRGEERRDVRSSLPQEELEVRFRLLSCTLAAAAAGSTVTLNR